MTANTEALLKLLDDRVALIEGLFAQYADATWHSVVELAERTGESPTKADWFRYMGGSLAFRLLNKARTDYWAKYETALLRVVAHCVTAVEDMNMPYVRWWMLEKGGPEHYIVAALIARKLKEGDV